MWHSIGKRILFLIFTITVIDRYLFSSFPHQHVQFEALAIEMWFGRSICTCFHYVHFIYLQIIILQFAIWWVSECVHYYYWTSIELDHIFFFANRLDIFSIVFIIINNYNNENQIIASIFWWLWRLIWASEYVTSYIYMFI